MKDFYTRANELLSDNDMNTVKTLSQEFGISISTANTRFRTYFGKTVRDYIRDKLTPSKADCDLALAMSEDVHEFKRITGLDKYPEYFKGLFDRYYGNSTFQGVKARLVAKIPCAAYEPTVHDNKALFLSQYFGDGSYDPVHNALRIEHGYKQADYLRFKVSLFNRAFPTTNGVEHIKKYDRKSAGYVSYSWYSGKLPESFVNASKRVDELTPLGIMLWYLDDGCYHVSQSGQHIISMCIPDEDVKQQALTVFKSYGVDFTVRDVELVLQDRVKVAMFMNCFTRPFLHMLPECMHYKCELKI
jgi:hypothetical protein